MFGDPFQNIRQLVKLPAHAMKTYQLAQPLATHFRDGRCEEAFCPAQERGWITKVDESSEIGQKQAHYIRKLSGRRYSEFKNEAGITEFTFPAGQQCFRQHKVPLERDPLLYVVGGDFRGNPRREKYQHKRADDWVDDFANHQIKISEAVEEG